MAPIATIADPNAPLEKKPISYANLLLGASKSEGMPTGLA